jgi:hypothetical protein
MRLRRGFGMTEPVRYGGPRDATGLLAWELDDEAVAGGQAILRLANPRIGADPGAGKYAVFFYDSEDREVLVVGGFDRIRDAGDAVPYIRARAVLNAAGRVWDDPTTPFQPQEEANDPNPTAGGSA